MARLFSNLWPSTATKFCSVSYKISKAGANISHMLYKLNHKLPKVCQSDEISPNLITLLLSPLCNFPCLVKILPGIFLPDLFRARRVGWGKRRVRRHRDVPDKTWWLEGRRILPERRCIVKYHFKTPPSVMQSFQIWNFKCTSKDCFERIAWTNKIGSKPICLFPASFLYFCLFHTVHSKQMLYIKVCPDDLIWTTDLYQLSHHHCPTISIFFIEWSSLP